MTTSSVTRKARVAVFTPAFLDDLRWWVRTDRKAALRLLDLVEAVLRDPFVGIGKPEPLKGKPVPFKGIGGNVWSRRLTHEHRMTYTVADDRIDFHQARYHY